MNSIIMFSSWTNEFQLSYDQQNIVIQSLKSHDLFDFTIILYLSF